MWSDGPRNEEGSYLVLKLSGYYVYPENIKKIKMSIAVQVFSQRVGAITKRIAIMTNFTRYKGIDSRAEDTCQYYQQYINNLFDSANGNFIKPSPGKEKSCVVRLY
ncbi:uncharacterized protein LOC112592415 [Melanaphis sacchari]|uniref:uncharacterized protein LOC112592415 n=1 Tax=Melanaphis sacchari TaxID=742174 RepID=UPI000DC1559B|nr:uncharacterized protein LOC112592415 [Melanaphis sacchari]